MGLGRGSVPVPTAHAVGYDLPPSGLKHQTQHAFARGTRIPHGLATVATGSLSCESALRNVVPFDHGIKQVFESGDSGLHGECLVHPQSPCRRPVAPSLTVGEAVFNRLHQGR